MDKQISCVKILGGVPTLHINGDPFHSPAYVTYLTGRNCYEKFGKAGIDLYSVCFFFGGQTINVLSEPRFPIHSGIFDKKGVSDFSEPDKALKLIIDANKNAKIFPRVNISPPAWWEEENPDELNFTGSAAGSPKRRVCFASQIWRDFAAGLLREMVEHYQNSEFAPHIVGYQIACGNTEEWFPFDQNGSMGQRLMEKYDAIKTDSSTDADLYNLAAEESASAISFFAEKMKEFTNNQLVIGAFYGYTFETPNRPSAHSGLMSVLRCPYVDFLCAPMSYVQTRAPGIDHACMTVLDSVLLHGKLYFTEVDERSYRSLYPYEYSEMVCKEGTYNQPIWKGPQDPFVSRNVLRNSFARQLIHGNNFWWFDMWGGWYDDEDVLSDMAIEAKVMKESVSLKNRQISAELAVIMDEKSHIHSPSSSVVVYAFRVPLGSCGVPYAAYEISDFEAIADKHRAFILLEGYATDKTAALKAKLDENDTPYLLLNKDTKLSPSLFREFCRENGLHIYSESDDVIYVNENYVSVHKAEGTDEKTVIKLPRGRKITPIFDGGEAFVSDKIELTLKSFETKLFRLE